MPQGSIGDVGPDGRVPAKTGPDEFLKFR
jgi:hypothetical protein